MNKTGILVTIAFIVVVAVTCALTSCCTSICEQNAPALRPMPKCDSQSQVQPTLQIPVERSGK
jgi:hypothetical protein